MKEAIGKAQERQEPTGYGLCVLSTLTPSNEYHISLADIGVAIL